MQARVRTVKMYTHFSSRYERPNTKLDNFFKPGTTLGPEFTEGGQVQCGIIFHFSIAYGTSRFLNKTLEMC